MQEGAQTKYDLRGKQARLDQALREASESIEVGGATLTAIHEQGGKKRAVASWWVVANRASFGQSNCTGAKRCWMTTSSCSRRASASSTG
jgi:hypothetical protein